MNNVKTVYEKQKPIMDATLELLPWIGPLFSGGIDKKFKEFQNSKRTEFMEVISKNKDTITTEMVCNHEFIVNTLRTAELVERLSSNDKVVYYGNLIRNGYLVGDKHISGDCFDEFISVLNELSTGKCSIFLNLPPTLGKQREIY